MESIYFSLTFFKTKRLLREFDFFHPALHLYSLDSSFWRLFTQEMADLSLWTTSHPGRAWIHGCVTQTVTQGPRHV